MWARAGQQGKTLHCYYEKLNGHQLVTSIPSLWQTYYERYHTKQAATTMEPSTTINATERIAMRMMAQVGRDILPEPDDKHVLANKVVFGTGWYENPTLLQEATHFSFKR